MNKLGKAWGQDMQRGCLVQLAGLAVAIFVILPLGCCLIFIPLSLASASPPGDNGSIILLAASSTLFLLILFGSIGFGMWYVLRRRANWLDERFAPLGLRGASYLLNGRKYQGIAHGREMTALFYRGPTLDLNISAKIGTRLTVAPRADVSQGLGKLFNQEPLPVTDPALADLLVYADDAAWGQALLANPTAVSLLTELLHAETSFLFQQIHFLPDTVRFKLYRNNQLLAYDVTSAQLTRWTEALSQLAHIAEALPPPAEWVEISALEQKARQGEIRFTAVALGILLLLGLPVVCIILVGVGIYLFTI